MLSRSIVRLLFLAMSSVLAGGCHFATPHQPERAISSVPATQPVPDRGSEGNLIEAHAHYATGAIYEAGGDPEQALREYSEAALRDPGDEALVLDVTRRLLLAGRLQQALEVLVRATAEPAASADLYARLGFVYSRLGQFESAIKADRNAIQRQPRSLAGYRNLFLNHLQNKQDKEAMNVLDEAAAVSRTDAEFLIGLAELYVNFGLQINARRTAAFGKALALLRRAEKLRSDDPQLRLRLADGFNLVGEDGEAAPIYLELLKHPPDTPGARENIRAKLVDIYLRGNDRQRAAEQLEAVIRDNPADVQAAYLLGGIAFDEKKYAAAADYFTRALLLNPEFEPAYYDLAYAQIAADRGREAQETLDRARRKFQPGFLGEYLSGLACSRQKDYSNAISHFTAAEAITPSLSTNRLGYDLYFQLGAACERNGDFSRAEVYLEKCLRLSPDAAEALNYLGYMWAERGVQLDRARELIEKALRAEPRNAAYLDSMGWVLFRLHQPQAALDFLLQAVQCSEGDDPVIYDHLGDVYTALGMEAKAREAWTRSVALEPNDVVRKKLQPATAP
jgi:tetratricopeptide (TPR) repeat protein